MGAKFQHGESLRETLASESTHYLDLLDQMFNFKHTQACHDQQASTCEQMVKLMQETIQSLLETVRLSLMLILTDVMGHIASAQCTYVHSASFNRARCRVKWYNCCLESHLATEPKQRVVHWTRWAMYFLRWLAARHSRGHLNLAQP